ncbi:MAG: threonylcarbamoyl-AMP synthase [Desulfobacterales bacterium]|nr:threonylcarbamoyl-AMP synthase [Desulfobacterales bacterium]
MRSDRIRRINPDRPDPDVIQEAAAAIAAAKVVVFPTRCLYGLGADAFDREAVEKVFALKHRPENKPILVLIRNRQEVSRLAAEIPEAAKKLMDGIWPGDLTLVFFARPEVPEILTAGTGKIGIRLPGHPAAAALVEAAGRPITGTSANLAGDPGVAQIQDLVPEIADQVDLILDAGPLKGGVGTIVVDVTVDPPKVLREGTVPASALAPFLTMQY